MGSIGGSLLETHMCEEKPEKKSLFSSIFTAIAFICTVCVLPTLIICFVFSKITKKIWIAVLSRSFPKLKFVEADSIRTLLDTLRNQGVISVLLTIRGVCDPEVVMQALEDHIVERRDKKGDLLYPILRLRLLSCWGNYAWAITDEFDIKNHVVVGSPKYRGRPVNEHNLQEYVTGITSKFLLSNQPPWQVTIIPKIISTEPTYGILVRVHHLVLEEGSLNIGDFLCLKPEADQFNDETNSSEFDKREEYDNTSPLSGVVYTPKAMSSLCNRLNDSLSNHWNEFISDFDPITSPDLLKRAPGFFDCLAITLITLVSAYKDTRKYIENSQHPKHVISHLLNAFNYERKKRNLTIPALILSLIITFNPISCCIGFIKILWWINIKCFIKIPVHFYQEYLAFKSYIRYGFCMHPNTAIGLLLNYLPLLFDAGKEICHIATLVYSAPAAIIYEMFFANKNFEDHHLQKTSSSGRKVVAWSEPISRKYINEIATREHVTETEILLTMASACIKDYFHHTHLPVPKSVSTVVKVVSYDKLLSTHDQKSDSEKSKGTIFLTLPMNNLCIGRCHDDIRSISKELKRVITSQTAINILTSCQDYLTEIFPSIYLRIFLNYTTKKFSVSILEVKEGKHNIHGDYRKTLWNDTITSILYWRPPQGNTGMSLTIQRYGDSVRLGVMTDSLLSPQHHAPARHWGRAVRKLHGPSHDGHAEASPSHSTHKSLRHDKSEHTSMPENIQEFSATKYNVDYGSAHTEDTDCDEREQNTESQEVDQNYSEHSNSSESQSSPTTYMYDYLLNSEYGLGDFIRDVQFDDENNV